MNPGAIAVIQRHVAAMAGVLPRELVSERRNKRITETRHLAMWLSSEMTPFSLARIGRAFGNRDRTTVMNGLEKAEILLERRSGLLEEMLKVRCAVEAELAQGSEVAEAVLLTEAAVAALRTALTELARRNPAKAIAVILPLAQSLAEGGSP